LKTLQEIQEEHSRNIAQIMMGWGGEQDQIQKSGLERGRYADQLSSEQRVAARQEQALEKAREAHERTLAAYHSELDRYEERVHLKRQDLRAKNFHVESTEALAAALGADDSRLLDMIETAELSGNGDLARAAFTAAHRRGLGDVVAAYFEKNPESYDAYQEWMALPDPEAIEKNAGRSSGWSRCRPQTGSRPGPLSAER
jgi:septal ring factor EnvC (AmiA/AmiB activator)